MRTTIRSVQTDCVTGGRLHSCPGDHRREEDSGGFPRFLYQEEGLLSDREDDAPIRAANAAD